MASDQKKNGEATTGRGNSSLSQVRELLVGPRFREYERRLARVTKRMSKEIETLRAEMQAQTEEMEEFVRSEFASLRDQLKQSNGSHGSAIKELQKETSTLSASSHKGLGRLEDKLGKATDSMKSFVTQQAEKVRLSMEKRCDELQGNVEALDEFVEAAESERDSMGKTFQQLVQTLTTSQKTRRK